MTDGVEWIKLPEKIWEETFEYLDVTSLLKATEACSKFADIFAQSRKLTTKVRMTLNTNDDMTSRLQTLMQSKRKYKHLMIASASDGLGIASTILETSQIEMMRKVFGESAESLWLIQVIAARSEIAELLTSFKNLKAIGLNFVYMSEHRKDDYARCNQLDDGDRLVLENYEFPFRQLQALVINKSDCFLFRLFRNSVSLKMLVINDLTFKTLRVEDFEEFLVKLIDLKDLRINNFQGIFIFKTDLLSSPPFQLETLALTSIYWEEKEKANAFVKSQFNLKSFSLTLRNRPYMEVNDLTWSNDILRHVFMFNKDLQHVLIENDSNKLNGFTNYEFLDGTVCSKVESLIYNRSWSEEGFGLMEAFTKMFPNLKRLKFSAGTAERSSVEHLISAWKKLDYLEIATRTDHFKNVQVSSEHLIELVLHPFLSMEFDRVEHEIAELNELEFIHVILRRHSTVQKLEIGNGNYSDLFSVKLADVVADSLPGLKVFTAFCLTSEAVKNLCSRAKNLQLIVIRARSIEANLIRDICSEHSIAVQVKILEE